MVIFIKCCLECLFVVVGARKRESVHGIQKAPPLSGDCFWQLEKANAPLNGEAFVFILCFMRGTLAIIVLKKYCLFISRVIFEVALLNGLIVAVVFFLGDQFKYGDHCRIKHLPTQQYLSVTQRGNRQKV